MRLVRTAVARGLSTLLAVGAALWTISPSLQAHHGQAAFDTTKTVTVTGIVTEFAFVNPHAQVYLDVKNEKGELEKWQGELTAPNKLGRAGWTKRTLKPGDKITIAGFRTANDSRTLWIRNLIGPTGESLPLFED